MNFSSNHHELNFLLTTALPGNTLNSKHLIQNGGTSLVILTRRGICRNPGLECDADKISPTSVAWTTVKMKIQHHSHLLRNAMTEQHSPGTRIQTKSWDEIPPASTSSSTLPQPTRKLCSPFHSLLKHRASYTGQKGGLVQAVSDLF